MDQISLIEEWMESTYTHPNLQTWLILYLKKRNKTRFQNLEGLPNSMRSIAEEQNRIGWAHFGEGRMTKRIRDMQTMDMCNRGSTYTEHHWMRDFVRNSMALTHEQRLGHILMQHPPTEGILALKRKEELAREYDRLLDTYIHNIADKNKLMLDMNPADVAVISMREI